MSIEVTNRLLADISQLESAVNRAIETFRLAQPELSVGELYLLRKPGHVACHAHIVGRRESLPNPADMAVS
jgi:hypothetical protein